MLKKKYFQFLDYVDFPTIDWDDFPAAGDPTDVQIKSATHVLSPLNWIQWELKAF